MTIGTCKRNDKDSVLDSILSSRRTSAGLYKQPSQDSQFYGLESHFHEDVFVYKDLTVYGNIRFDALENGTFIINNLAVIGTSTFFGPADFYDNVYIDQNINVGILTARDKINVGCDGLTFTADNSTGNVGIGITTPRQKLDVVGTVIVSDRIGIGSTAPEQRVDVAGSVKIDATIYDSSNTPGANGYFLAHDDRGVRWIPLVAENIDPNSGFGTIIGLATSGIFVLDEMVPLPPTP